ncbi:DUF1800 family protein [Photobacterium minamisatsumaniensis]|uniref:DUF1800 family protein n=1 Tax=Photobacterium minamisatsumaniensis TaxID=2910233 RepID=UPI003D0B496C
MSEQYRQAYRSLVQCTFGPKEQDIDNFLSFTSISQWAEQQKALPRTSWQSLFEYNQNNHDKPGWTDVHLNCSWMHMTIEKEDILRQRIAYIFTQLFVISKNVPTLRSHDRKIAFANYYDQLSQHCLSSFRDTLGVMARHALMGEFLTYRDNNYKEGKNPDENFAREILQLFTLGPIKLNQNATPVLDDDGKEVPSYTQADIENLARVFTGWQLDNGDWLKPMVDSGSHDTSSKFFLGQGIPGGMSADNEMDLVLDILTDHPNTAPYIVKFFIQKMVTANPSPEYIQRVANEFSHSQGDMMAILVAILDDPEAKQSGGKYDGKLREPEIVYIHAHRALGIQRRPEKLTWDNLYSWRGQRFWPMAAPSVFYYYQPDGSPSDEAFANHASPEFAVYNWIDCHYYHDQIRRACHQHGGIEYDFYQFKSLFEQFEDEALITKLDHQLFGYTMPEKVKAAVRKYLVATPSNRSSNTRLWQLFIQLIFSPSFHTQG